MIIYDYFWSLFEHFLTIQKSKMAAGIQDGSHLEKLQYVYVLWRNHVT